MKTITEWGEWFVDQKYPYEFEIGNCRGMFDHVQRTEAFECGKRYKGLWPPSDWVKEDLLGVIQKAGKETLLEIEQYTLGTWLEADLDITTALLDAVNDYIDAESLYKLRDSGKGI
jgi:hypothetical protein